MKKLLTIIITLFVCSSSVSIPVLAVSTPTNPIDLDSSTYAIISENYVGDWSDYNEFDYDFSDGMDYEKVKFRVKATYRYNEATGKVYGSPGTLSIEAKALYHDLVVFEIYNINYSTPTVTSDGYAWKYPNITFNMKMGYINPIKTYTNITVLGTQYVPG